MSKCIKCGNLFINNPPDDEMCHICKIADLEAKLAEKGKEIAIRNEKLNELKNELHKRNESLQDQLALTEKALELAVQQLDDAKDMLRGCGKRDWAGILDTSVDYFKARAKEMKDE